MRIVNWSNYTTKHNANPEGSKGPSKTIPGQSMPLKELVSRYMRGQNVIVHEGVFSDETMIPDNLERMDPMDRIDYARQLREGIKEIQTKPRPKPTPVVKPTEPYPAPQDNPTERPDQK